MGESFTNRLALTVAFVNLATIVLGWALGRVLEIWSAASPAGLAPFA